MKIQARWLVGLSAGVLFTCASGAASAAFSRIYVFGDSLSDNGNLFIETFTRTRDFTKSVYPNPPYWSGRASNGRVAVEHMADHLLAGGALGGQFFDYAYGGSYTGRVNSWDDGSLGYPAGSLDLPGTLDQLDRYVAGLGGASADPAALYVVWAGPNDFVSVADPNQIPTVIQAAVTNIATAVGTLAGLGAANILVPNMVDLGVTPRIQLLGQPAIAGATMASMAFNQALAGALGQIDQSPAVEIYDYDVFGYVQDVLADLTAYGLESSGSYLLTCGANPSDPLCADPNNFLFFDDLHPTALGHQLIGKEFASAVPLPASLWLLASALALLGLRTNGRRRR